MKHEKNINVTWTPKMTKSGNLTRNHMVLPLTCFNMSFIVSTALWKRNNKILNCFDTEQWKGGGGGGVVSLIKDNTLSYYAFSYQVWLTSITLVFCVWKCVTEAQLIAYCSFDLWPDTNCSQCFDWKAKRTFRLEKRIMVQCNPNVIWQCHWCNVILQLIHSTWSHCVKRIAFG